MANDRWREEDADRRNRMRERYEDEYAGQGGGYGQSNLGLGFEGSDEAYGDSGPYRVPPSPAGGGYHHGAYSAEQYRGRSEREPGGRRARMSGQGYYSPTGERMDSIFEYDTKVTPGEGRLSSPGHRGRGPRNYKRSDERIREDVSDNLMENAELDASDIEVLVESGEVTLNGTVGDRSDKRLAEDLAEVRGVEHVQNNLRIQRSDADTTPRQFSR